MDGTIKPVRNHLGLNAIIFWLKYQYENKFIDKNGLRQEMFAILINATKKLGHSLFVLISFRVQIPAACVVKNSVILVVDTSLLCGGVVH